MTDPTTAPAADPTTAPAAAPALTDEAVSGIAAALFADPTDLGAYLAADRSGRSRIRVAVKALASERLSAAMFADGDPAEVMAAARAERTLGESVVAAVNSARANASAAPVVDWNGLVAQRVANLIAAASSLALGDARPADMPDDVTIDLGDLPDPDNDAVARIVGERLTRRSPSNDIAAVVRAAMSDLSDGGTMTIRAIARHWHAAGGPANGDGRIRARIEATDRDGAPACTIPGVRAGRESATGPLVAVKVGDWSHDA